jgi:sigma-B regulation protein RsbU (phosphoserine phosphatase)
MDFNNKNETLIKQIIDSMYDWVRVIDRDNNIIFVNKAMAEGLHKYPANQKCYQAIGRSSPCENCISRKAVFEGRPHQKEEVIDNKIFSVASSPVKNNKDEITAVVEVLRDITQLKKLQQKILEQNKKLNDDLNIARKLQCSLLPKELPQDKVNFSFIYKPCETLGGDFLDVFKIGDDRIGLYIADVSGHGVSSSMLTVFLRTSINKKLTSPSQILKDLYKAFNNFSFNTDLYITVFYAIINLKDKTLVFSNAGHNVAPIVFNKDRFELLRVAGIPISNWVDEAQYVDKLVQLKTGDRLFVYTDGIVELKNSSHEQFGEDRLLNILLNSDSAPGSTLNSIYDSACKFAGTNNPSYVSDDITMALLEIKEW